MDTAAQSSPVFDLEKGQPAKQKDPNYKYPGSPAMSTKAKERHESEITPPLRMPATDHSFEDDVVPVYSSPIHRNILTSLLYARLPIRTLHLAALLSLLLGCVTLLALYTFVALVGRGSQTQIVVVTPAGGALEKTTTIVTGMSEARSTSTAILSPSSSAVSSVLITSSLAPVTQASSATSSPLTQSLTTLLTTTLVTSLSPTAKKSVSPLTRSFTGPDPVGAVLFGGG